ncbi:MAG: hypothetical protein AAFW83_01535 [Pseudomonadota bacterium]
MGQDTTIHTPKEQKIADTSFGPPVLDMDHYLPMVADLDLSESEKEELIGVVWNILVSMAELNLGLDSVQMLLAHEVEKDASVQASVVTSDIHQVRDCFNETKEARSALAQESEAV